MSVAACGWLDSCLGALDTKKGKEKSFACENSMRKTSAEQAGGPQNGGQVGLQTRMEQVAPISLGTWGPSSLSTYQVRTEATWERQLPPSRGQGAHQWASAAPGPLAEDERGCQASPGPSGRWGPLWKMSGRGLPGRQVFSRNSQHFTAKATCLQNHDSCQRASEALTPLVCLEAAHPL